MRGRSLNTEIFPLTFTEICCWDTLPKTTTVSTENRVLLEERFKRCLTDGTFPEIVLSKEEYHRKILQNYYETIFYKDVIDRYNPSNPNLVKLILKILINQIAQPYTINKIYEKIKSMGYKLQKELIHDVLIWFNDAYLLYSVPIFTKSIHKQNTNPKKLYCIDNGIVNAVTGNFLENRGQMLENFVFSTLRHKTEEIFYYKNTQGYELDFLVYDEQKPTESILLQVCESLLEEKTRTREIRGLLAALDDFQITKGYIITLNESESIKQDNKEICVIPAWKWCLSAH